LEIRTTSHSLFLVVMGSTHRYHMQCPWISRPKPSSPTVAKGLKNKSKALFNGRWRGGGVSKVVVKERRRGENQRLIPKSHWRRMCVWYEDMCSKKKED
jgi:hypothetical protein